MREDAIGQNMEEKQLQFEKYENQRNSMISPTDYSSNKESFDRARALSPNMIKS